MKLFEFKKTQKSSYGKDYDLSITIMDVVWNHYDNRTEHNGKHVMRVCFSGKNSWGIDTYFDDSDRDKYTKSEINKIIDSDDREINKAQAIYLQYCKRRELDPHHNFLSDDC